MKPIGGMALPTLPIAGLAHVRDLVYFDGPLLSQFAHPNGDQYLQYWCDCDETANRWMIFRVNEASILRLVNRFVPMDYEIPSGCRDDFVYFVDIANSRSLPKVAILPVTDVPEDYKPAPGEYLELPLAKFREKNAFSVLVEGGKWATQAISDFPNVFAKVYSVLYGLNVLHVPEFEGFPWKGGFSSLHFFNWAFKQIPFESRPNVSAIQYASPGFIRFSLDELAAAQVATCVAEYFSNNAKLASAYSDISNYIRANNLREIPSEFSAEWPKHDEPLKSRTIALLAGFSKMSGETFVKVCPRPFEAAQIARAFYRYVRDLAAFEKNGMVRFPRFN